MPGVLECNTDFPIKTDKPVHFGKVRAVYWLTAEDSARLIKENKYNVTPDAELAVMVISDRISAFDCIWKGENGLNGVPGKGAALNAIANHWFKLFREKGLADSHILDVPHPLVWIVQKAKPVRETVHAATARLLLARMLASLLAAWCVLQSLAETTCVLVPGVALSLSVHPSLHPSLAASLSLAL
jgi:hypothetical protein